MWTALQKSINKKVTADDAKKEDGPFYCESESCKGLLILKKGFAREDHFSHKASTNCDYAGESILHLKIKKDIYIFLTKSLKERVLKIEQEKQLGNSRPDVYVEGRKKKIAIEIQASDLTAEQIIERTKRYFEKGIYVLWILPFDKKRLLTSLNGKECWKEIKLKEYERIIFYMFSNQIIFWDLKHEYSDGFIVINYEDSWTEGTYDYEPKKLKTIKRVKHIKNDLQLQDFAPIYEKEFKMPSANYYLPERYIMNYEGEK